MYDRYEERYAEDLIDYFNKRPTAIKKLKNREGVEIEEEVANDLPTLHGFAAKLGVSVGTLGKWAEKHEDFKRAMDRRTAYQGDILINNGLHGRYNPRFAGLAAKNILKWSENYKVESENTVKSSVTLYMPENKRG